MSAGSIFEDIRSRRWSCISEWLANHEPESLHFDFKQKSNPAAYRLDEGDRANIAKAMSGFANGGGGVLVIGLARTPGKHRDDPDLVGSVNPIVDVQRFLECLDREAAEFTEPPIAGLDFLAIESLDGTGGGVVAMLIPSSDAVPHRVLKGSNDYFIRIGTRTMPMPHQLLAEQFGRRPAPRLRLAFKLHGEGVDCVLALRLQNSGRGLARQPAIQFTEPHPAFDWSQAHLGNLSRGWNFPNNFGQVSGVIYQSDANIIIYPDSELVVGALRKVAGQQIPRQLDIRGRIYCVDATAVDFEGTVQHGQEILLPG